MLFSGFMMILLDQMTSYCVDFTEIGFNASFEAWKHSYDVTFVKYQFLLLLLLVCHVIMYFQALQAD